jgi:hypothetical protein
MQYCRTPPWLLRCVLSSSTRITQNAAACTLQGSASGRHEKDNLYAANQQGTSGMATGSLINSHVRRQSSAMQPQTSGVWTFSCPRSHHRCMCFMMRQCGSMHACQSVLAQSQLVSTFRPETGSCAIAAVRRCASAAPASSC